MRATSTGNACLPSASSRSRLSRRTCICSGRSASLGCVGRPRRWRRCAGGLAHPQRVPTGIQCPAWRGRRRRGRLDRAAPGAARRAQPVCRPPGRPVAAHRSRRWPATCCARDSTSGRPRYLVGENGSGKSTLVEAIAIAYGLVAGGRVDAGCDSAVAGEAIASRTGLGRAGWSRRHSPSSPACSRRPDRQAGRTTRRSASLPGETSRSTRPASTRRPEALPAPPARLTLGTVAPRSGVSRRRGRGRGRGSARSA